MSEIDFLKSMGLNTETEQTEQTTQAEETTQQTEQTTEQKTQTQQTETTEQSTQQTETQTTDYNKLVAEKFGYSSVDDLINSEASDKLKKYDEVIGRLQLLEAENAEFLSEASNLGNPFVNENVLKLNALMKDNPNLDVVTASKLLTTDMSSLSNIDKIKLAIQVENPDYTDRHIEREIQRKFGVENISELYDSELDANIKLDMDIEAKKALKVLDKFKVASDLKYESTLVPEKIKEKVTARQQAMQQNVEAVEKAWLPIVADIEANFKEAPLPTWDSKLNQAVNDFIKFVIPESERKQAAQDALNIAKQFNLKEVTPEIEQTVKVEVWKNLLMRNIARIIQTTYDKGVSAEFARLKAIRDGAPASTTKKETPDSGDNKNNSIDALLETKSQGQPWQGRVF